MFSEEAKKSTSYRDSAASTFLLSPKDDWLGRSTFYNLINYGFSWIDNVAMEDLENETDSVNSFVGKKQVKSTHSEFWEYFQRYEVVEGGKQICYCKECKKSHIWREG